MAQALEPRRPGDSTALHMVFDSLTLERRFYRGCDGLVAKKSEEKCVGGRTLEWCKVKVQEYALRNEAGSAEQFVVRTPDQWCTLDPLAAPTHPHTPAVPVLAPATQTACYSPWLKVRVLLRAALTTPLATRDVAGGSDAAPLAARGGAAVAAGRVAELM